MSALLDAILTARGIDRRRFEAEAEAEADLYRPTTVCRVCAGPRTDPTWTAGPEPLCPSCAAWVLAFDAWDEPARIAASLAAVSYRVHVDAGAVEVLGLTPAPALERAVEAEARRLLIRAANARASLQEMNR